MDWMRRLAALFVLTLVTACSGAPPNGDAAAESGGAALRLECATPLSTPLVPQTSGTTPGVPSMGVAWEGDHCAFVTDDTDPNLVLYIADFTGTALRDLVAARAGRWAIAWSSTEPGPTTYISGLPRDTDISVLMTRADARSDVNVMITFRVEGSTLVLLSMHLA